MKTIGLVIKTQPKTDKKTQPKEDKKDDKVQE